MAIVLPAPSSSLVDDLYDLVRCYGRAVPEGPHLFVTAIHPKPVLVAVSALLNVKAMDVSGSHEGVLDTEAARGESDSGVRVRWDARLRVEDVATCIAGIDDILRTFDGTDRKGRRMRVPFGLSEKLFRRSVMATFVDRSVLIPVGRASALETIRRQFDHPELLTPFQDRFGDWYLCLAAEDEVRWRDLAMLRAQERMGVTNIRGFASFGKREWEKLNAFFKEEFVKKPN